MRIALVTSSALPDLDPDDRLLPPAFAARGVAAVPAIWDDAQVDWNSFDAVLLRSPWDYYRRYGEFLAWAERLAARLPLFNPLPLVRWNSDKHYLAELAARRLPVVPTAVVERGERCDLAALLGARGWRRAVLKPAISADSWETCVVAGDDPAPGQAHLDRLIGDRAMLVQPFLPAVESHGERCLIFFDGAFSHAVRKNALTQGGRHAGLPEGVAVVASAAEIEAASRLLAAVPLPRPLYARVDLVPSFDGRPLLLELELFEPTLFFATAAGSAERFVDRLLARLAEARLL